MTADRTPLMLGARTFAGVPGQPLSAHTWPADGWDLTDEGPQTQYYVHHNRGVSRCGPTLGAVLELAHREVEMGYNALLGCQKVAVVRPDGRVTRWDTALPPTRPGERAPRPVGYGYQLEPTERVPNWTFPAYPARYLPDDDGRREALTDAAALAAVAGHPVVVGLVLTWENWH